MLDTINFKITRAEVEGVDFIDEITPHLNPDTIGEHCYNDSLSVTGKVGNLIVSINPHQVKVKDGSLCKWMLGDNYQSMERGDIQRAVERLSDTLHLPMERARITRLDVGLSIPVKEPIANYFNHLGQLKYAHRLQQPDSLYYYRHRRAERLCFYDKNREQRAHHEPVPDLYRDCNVLRYEQRYMERLPRLLNVSQVTGAMLYDEAFYISLLNRWRDCYREISKINDITLNYRAMKTQKEFNRLCRLMAYEQMGGEIKMFSQIAEAQKRGELTATQACRLRQTVSADCKTKDGLTMPSECISELDKKITEAIRYYR